MNRDQLIKILRKQARASGLSFSAERKRGKGSHITLRYAGKFTTCPDGEIKEGTRRAILKQLGADKR
jgi:predicted RNA binding protein YcfA (HicA-like mRNA interferase family)